MVIWPVSAPTEVGAKVTVMAQAPPTGTGLLRQLFGSVQVNSPLRSIEVSVRARLPVFSTVTVSELLE